MIVFVNYGKHYYTHNALIGQPGLCNIVCCNYDWLLNQEKPPPATYIFMDRERMDLWELKIFSALFQHLNKSGSGYRAINNPAQMLNRRSLLRALYAEGFNDFNAYALTERCLPKRYPVFLRREHDHDKPLTDLLRNEEALLGALTALRRLGEPEDGLMIVEYCAEPVSGNLFRKLSAYRIGDQTIFYNTVHENNWLVKYGTLNSATDLLYEEEQAMVRNNAFRDELSRAFQIARIDYGRADFGLVNGKVQVYEINTNPSTKPPEDHPNPIRTQTQLLAWEKYCAALSALDTTDPNAPRAAPFKHQYVKTKKGREHQVVVRW